jgi:hypothetical protein
MNKININEIVKKHNIERLRMNESIVDCYGIAMNCNIAKEEAVKLIHAILRWERASRPYRCHETDTTPEEEKENLIQAIAECQNALDSLVYKIGLDKSAIQQEIKEANEKKSKAI